MSLRAHCPVLVQEGAVSVTAILAALPGTTPVRVDDKAWGRQLRHKSPLQGGRDEFFWHGGPHVAADHVLGSHILKGA